jgi:hypothetical protein
MALKKVEEDNISLELIIKDVSNYSTDIQRVVEALDLGKSMVKEDGVYRIFNDGTEIKITSGTFKKRHLRKLKYSF